MSGAGLVWRVLSTWSGCGEGVKDLWIGRDNRGIGQGVEGLWGWWRCVWVVVVVGMMEVIRVFLSFSHQKEAVPGSKTKN